MSALERFEDEKRRIIESCFAKLDSDGAMQESYITHVRIEEDNAYQSSPPPPNAAPEQKKPRIIIVAVRKSGRVRMHKARENSNGTFSIGKTWPLDDLSTIQSYSGMTPRTPLEEQHKQWAGDTGFTVTIGKPYYWKANSGNEKLFFVSSLTKIYIKYTGGRPPGLIGFTNEETARIFNSRKRPSAPPSFTSPQSDPPQFSSPNSVSSGPNGRAPPPRQPGDRELAARPSTGGSAQPGLRQPRPQVSTPNFDPRPPATANSLLTKETDSAPLPLSQTQRAPTSQPRMPSDIRSKTSSFSTQREASNRSNLTTQSSYGAAQAPIPDTSGLPPSLRPGPPGGQRTPTSDRFPPSISSPQPPTSQVPPVPMVSDAPPERRRPPLHVEPKRANSRDPAIGDMVPAPLATPSQRDFMRPPARSIDRPEAPMPLRVRPGALITEGEGPRTGTDRGDSPTVATPKERAPPKAEEQPQPQTEAPKRNIFERPTVAEAPSSPPKPDIKSPEAADTPTSPEPMPEGPSLEPMIKKKSKAEVASAFRKMATAAAAKEGGAKIGGFKPRAGGAAERIRLLALEAKNKEKQNSEPDGITGVVPAPSLLRRATEEAERTSRPGTADPSTKVENKSIDSSRNGSLDLRNAEEKITAAEEKERPKIADERKPSELIPQLISPEKARKKKIDEDEAKRQKVVEETRAHLKSINASPQIATDPRAVEFATLLDDFGWRGEGVRTKSIEEINAEIERALNDAQIGGWFERLDEEDERVQRVRGGLDGCIAEVEELDGLLMIYGVELGTLGDDIAYIEAQSQGLQVHAANQKLLATEVKNTIRRREEEAKQAELDRQRRQREEQLRREESQRRVDSPATSFATGDSSLRESLEERGSSRGGTSGGGIGGGMLGDEEKEKKKKMGAWKSVRKKFHAPGSHA